MKYSLLKNGVDSLKAAYLCLEKLPDLQDGIEHNIKDAILSLNHGIEILFKLLLKNHHEYLIFSDLDKFMSAKERMIDQGKNNVFEVNPELRTITLSESVRRLSLLCEMDIPVKLKLGIHYFNKVRNKIMHYEIELNEAEVIEVVEKLRSVYEVSIEFFKLYIDDLEDLMESARFEYTEDDYGSDMAEYHAELMMEEYKLGLYDRD